MFVCGTIMHEFTRVEKAFFREWFAKENRTPAE